MKNIPSVKAQERITQSRLLYPSAMRPEQTTPLERPKQTAPFERRAPSAGRRAPSAERPFFQSKQFLGGFITTRVNLFALTSQSSDRTYFLIFTFPDAIIHVIFCILFLLLITKKSFQDNVSGINGLWFQRIVFLCCFTRSSWRLSVALQSRFLLMCQSFKKKFQSKFFVFNTFLVSLNETFCFLSLFFEIQKKIWEFFRIQSFFYSSRDLKRVINLFCFFWSILHRKDQNVLFYFLHTSHLGKKSHKRK